MVREMRDDAVAITKPSHGQVGNRGDAIIKTIVAGVLGAVSVVAEEETMAVVVYEHAAEGEGVTEDDVGGGATFVRICVST